MNKLDPTIHQPIQPSSDENQATNPQDDKIQKVAIDFLNELPPEIIQHIANHVPLSGLAGLAQQNLMGRDHAEPVILARAKKGGYAGTNLQGAKRFIKALNEETRQFCESVGGLPKSRNHDGTVNIDATWLNIENLSMADIFQIFSHKEAYGTTFPKLKKLLIDQAKKLQLNGANPNLQTDRVDPILHLAVRYGDKQMVDILLKANADLTRTNANGETALNLSIKRKQDKITESLLQLPQNLDIADVEGCTPLHSAVQNGDIKTVPALLNAGANPNLPNGNSHTPLDLAQELGLQEIAMLIQAHLANLN